MHRALSAVNSTFLPQLRVEPSFRRLDWAPTRGRRMRARAVSSQPVSGGLFRAAIPPSGGGRGRARRPHLQKQSETPRAGAGFGSVNKCWEKNASSFRRMRGAPASIRIQPPRPRAGLGLETVSVAEGPAADAAGALRGVEGRAWLVAPVGAAGAPARPGNRHAKREFGRSRNVTEVGLRVIEGPNRVGLAPSNRQTRPESRHISGGICRNGAAAIGKLQLQAGGRRPISGRSVDVSERARHGEPPL